MNYVKTIKKQKLNLKQELFCQYFVNDSECQGNGALSYLKAYLLDSTPEEYMKSYRTGAVNASKLLTKTNISRRISELLNLVLNENLADTELAYVMSQKNELGPKVQAIKEFNALKGRIQEKIDITSKGEKIDKINYVLPNGNNASPNTQTTSS